MRVLLVFALAACGSAGHVSTGPAWPRPAVREVDGGESLAPRAAARAIAARVEEDKPAERPAVDRPATPSAAPAAASDRSSQTASGPMAPEELPGEEIIIEIDD